MLNLEQFISKYVTERDSSRFQKNIDNNRAALIKTINAAFSNGPLSAGFLEENGKSLVGRMQE